MPHLTLAIALLIAPLVAADALRVELRGTDVLVGITRLNLVDGPVATRLRNGLPVAFDFHLALWSGSKSNLRRRAFERFVVSYDLWEERYAVTGLRKPRISATRLKPEEIGPWCLRNIKLTELDLSRDKQIWVRLDVNAADPKQSNEIFDDNGVSLVNLIETLSRPAKGDTRHWTFETGALQVAELRQ